MVFITRPRPLSITTFQSLLLNCLSKPYILRHWCRREANRTHTNNDAERGNFLKENLVLGQEKLIAGSLEGLCELYHTALQTRHVDVGVSSCDRQGQEAHTLRHQPWEQWRYFGQQNPGDKFCSRFPGSYETPPQYGGRRKACNVVAHISVLRNIIWKRFIETRQCLVSFVSISCILKIRIDDQLIALSIILRNKSIVTLQRKISSSLSFWSPKVHCIQIDNKI